MMWLGVVLHVSLNHIVGDSPAPWRDPQTTLIADLLIAFIHAFRMPVFFIFASLPPQAPGLPNIYRVRKRNPYLPASPPPWPPSHFNGGGFWFWPFLLPSLASPTVQAS
jgi:hypothetical protein